MLIARDEQGDLFSLVDSYQREWLQTLRAEKSFYCPVCSEPLLLKLGTKKCFHFAHQSLAHCKTFSEAETPIHIQGKKDLYEWLHGQGYPAEIEHYISAINQRTDVWLKHFPKNIPIEFQCSTLPLELLLERDRGYRTQDQRPIWIWSEERLRVRGSHIYQFSSLEWSTRRFPFTQGPLSQDQRNKAFLTFYNPTTKMVTFLYHLIPINTRYAWAKKLCLSLQELPLLFLTTPQLNLRPSQKWISQWLELKKKWRTSRVSRKQVFEQNLQRLANRKGLIWKAFPGVVGLPLGDDGMLETPNYLWQGWLCLLFVVNQPAGALILLETIKQEWERLIVRKQLIVRPMCDQRRHPHDSIATYLQCLCDLGILSDEMDRKRFVIKKQLRWPEPFYDQLLEEDKQVLENWMSRAK